MKQVFGKVETCHFDGDVVKNLKWHTEAELAVRGREMKRHVVDSSDLTWVCSPMV